LTALQRLRMQPNLTPRSSALLPVRITTARRPDHIRLSALVWSRSTQFIAHTSSQLGHGPPKRGHCSAILAGFTANNSFFVSARDPFIDEGLFPCVFVVLLRRGGTAPQIMV